MSTLQTTPDRQDHPLGGRGRYDATVLASELICREHYRLRLSISANQQFPDTRPGQFIQLGCRNPGLPADDDAILGRTIEWTDDHWPKLSQPELCGQLATLRKPFSLSGRGKSNPNAQGKQDDWLEIIHRVVGKGTTWLSHLKTGDKVDFIGPLGNTFSLPEGKSRGLLVGGGVGLPPMFYLAQAMKAAGWDAVGFVGALTRDLLAVGFMDGVTPSTTGDASLCVKQFADCSYPAIITTDDGSMGLKGRITLGLDKVLASLSKEEAAKTVLYTCGPEPMMHAAYDLATKYGVDVQVCLEQAMACGMGTCQSCIVKIEDKVSPQGRNELGRDWRYKLACTDGPVFEGPKVVW